MSLATRCPVCQTVFRVVQDQLKVSEGWVRCGRCAKVFNAFEGLFDLEREFPALQRASAAGTSSSASPSQRVLEDLARRNPRPQHGAQWEQELDTRATVREATPPPMAPAPRAAPAPSAPPTHAPTPGPSANATTAPFQRPVAPPLQPSTPNPFHPSAPAGFKPSVPAPFQSSAPAPFQSSAPAPFKSSAPAPFKPSSPAPFQPSAPAPFQPSAPAPFQPSAPAPFQPSAPAPFQPSAPAPFKAAAPAPFQVSAPAPFQVSAPAPFQPSAPAPAGTSPAPAAPVTSRTAITPPAFRPGTPAANDDATVAPMGALKSAAAVPGTAPSATPKPAGAPAVGIRDEPAPLAGAADSGSEPEDTFEALFRSDGELAEPATATDDVDIVLDGSDVEPAALDDAVDSRLLTFVQQADKAERWRRPWVRAAVAGAAVVLALLLAAQLAVVRRDAVVAQWPEARSLVQTLCAPLDCRIEPLRRIEQVSVDSSGLTRIDDGPVYRLALVLRNRGDVPLLTPSIDLSLTDASGALVSRRVLSAGELGASRTTIAAQQELPLQALLMSADRPLTGYTIEIFYP